MQISLTLEAFLTKMLCLYIFLFNTFIFISFCTFFILIFLKYCIRKESLPLEWLIWIMNTTDCIIININWLEEETMFNINMKSYTIKLNSQSYLLWFVGLWWQRKIKNHNKISDFVNILFRHKFNHKINIR